MSARGLIVALLACLTFGLAGFGAGQTFANNGLPDCQEDEYLYPVDFTGPGNNVTTDYRCHNFEELP